ITRETTHCSIDAATFPVNASERAAINAPTGSFNGRDGSGTGSGTINAELTQNGSFTSSGDHVAGGISLTEHIHGGVQSGGGSTGRPQ
ncbi:MAG: hypothetical protein LIP77_05775, partial [Planctomycetes bacterium]|nr:hypothetical protein [Planctomycetota bacterium]